MRLSVSLPAVVLSAELDVRFPVCVKGCDSNGAVEYDLVQEASGTTIHLVRDFSHSHPLSRSR